LNAPSRPATVPRPAPSVFGLPDCAGRGFAMDGFAGDAPSGLEKRGGGGFATRGGNGRPPTAFASVDRVDFGAAGRAPGFGRSGAVI